MKQHAAPSTDVGDERDDTAEQIVEARGEGLGGIEPREVHLQPPVGRLQPLSPAGPREERRCGGVAGTHRTFDARLHEPVAGEDERRRLRGTTACRAK